MLHFLLTSILKDWLINYESKFISDYHSLYLSKSFSINMAYQNIDRTKAVEQHLLS